MTVFDRQWRRILTEGPFSEECRIVLGSGEELRLRGILSYGYDGDDSETRYQNPRQRSFWNFKSVVPECGSDALKGAVATVSGQSYKVLQASGNSGGELLLDLRPVKGEPGAADS